MRIPDPLACWRDYALVLESALTLKRAYPKIPEVRA